MVTTVNQKRSKLFCCGILILALYLHLQQADSDVNCYSGAGFNMTGIKANARVHKAGASVSSHRQCHQ